MAIIIIASSLAKKARSTIVDADRACSNERSGENKCSNGMPEPAGRICTLVRPICYGGRL